ncbi:hypothetical protein D3C87_1922810 [compost metagenome]
MQTASGMISAGPIVPVAVTIIPCSTWTRCTVLYLLYRISYRILKLYGWPFATMILSMMQTGRIMKNKVLHSQRRYWRPYSFRQKKCSGVST